MVVMYIATPSQMKAAEECAAAAGVSYARLMENAGAAIVDEILSQIKEIYRKKALVICGKGNNGGDGFVAARLLAEKCADVTVVLACGRPPKGIALDALKKVEKNKKIKVCTIDEADTQADYFVIIDAVFGLGFHGELPSDIAEFFGELSRSSALKLAVDIPSGANAGDGSVSRGTMMCGTTVTFGTVKTGMKLNPARQFCGRIITASIGIDDKCIEAAGSVPVLIDSANARDAIPMRGEMSHKGTFGRLLVVAGSDNMSGAAALNVLGAVRSGAGLVRLASVPNVVNRVGSGIYECTFLELKAAKGGIISPDNIGKIKEAAEKSACVAIGGGLSVTDGMKTLVREMIAFCGEKNIPLIIDADGLNCIGSRIDIIRNAKCRAVLTPHPAELGRLAGVTTQEIMSDRVSYALSLAEGAGAIVVAKGYPTYIASPDGRIRVSYTGNGGLARGGSGDVLTGIISGIVTSNSGHFADNPDLLFDSVCTGVYVLGFAADLAADNLSATGMLPSDAAAMLPRAYKILGR